jgi:hypothetical protein
MAAHLDALLKSFPNTACRIHKIERPAALIVIEASQGDFRDNEPESSK